MKSATQRAVDLPLCDADAVVVGVELGSAIIRAGVFTSDHTLLGKTKLTTKLERGPDVVIERIAKCIRYAVDECDLEMSRVARIGIAAPGQILDHSVVANSVDLGWENIPLRSQLGAQIDLPITVGQLYNVAALGIQATELAQPAQRFAAIFVGPRIGAAVRIGSEWQELAGVSGFGVDTEQLCNHIVASEPHAIFGQFRGRDFRKALKKSENAGVRDYASRLAELAGDVAARLHQAFALETIVLGGALMDEMKEEIMAKAQEVFAQRTPPERREACKILASELGDLGPVTGAALWSQQLCAAAASSLTTSA